MMRASAILFLLMLLLEGCSNPAPEAEEDAATGEKAQLAADLPRFFDYLKAADSGFSVSRFIGGEVDPAEPQSALPVDTSSLRPFLPYLIYNSDSSRAVDLVSYNYIPVRKGNRVVYEEAGPDYEAAMIDFKNNSRQRLLFFGTMGCVLDAKWRNDSTIILGGSLEEKADTALRPAVWIYERSTGMRSIFVYPSFIRGNASGYPGPGLPH